MQSGARAGGRLDSLVRYGASLPHDFDDASLIRVARREYRKKIKVPPDHIARAIAHSSASYDAIPTMPRTPATMNQTSTPSAPRNPDAEANLVPLSAE
jgi:hypothetical protein